MRHAFDADHIAAIDNTTRKLMNEGKRPLSVGFFFSLGHSTIVFVLAFLFAIGIRALSGQVENDGSTLHSVTGWIGTGVSGHLPLRDRRAQPGHPGRHPRGSCGEMKRGELRRGRARAASSTTAGLMNRFYRRFTKAITKPWQMYPLGVLFGLGFDTATEVALLFLAAGAAGAGLPFYAILCLPILFAAGMSLLDTIDGSFMNFAYGWAFSKPVRKIFYNLTITALSVFVALVIGSIEIFALACREARPERRGLGLARGDRPQHDRLRDRRPVRRHLGRSRWRSGTSAASRSAGRRGSSSPSDRARRQPAPRSFADIEEVFALLRAEGHRVTAPSRFVLEALFAAEGPISAQQIADDSPSAGLEPSSVYRNLERLEELGVVRHVHLGHGPEPLHAGRLGRARVPALRALRPGQERRPVASSTRVRDAGRARASATAPRFGHFPIVGLCAECARAER